MIRGSVDAGLQARVGLRLRGPAGAELDLNAVIDTGFDDSLILGMGLLVNHDLRIGVVPGGALEISPLP